MLVIGELEMSKTVETFKHQLSQIKNNKSAIIRIVCTAEQRSILEKQLAILVGFPYVDKRKYATTYFLPTGSKVILLHERLVHSLFKSKIDIDVRKWTQEQLNAFFKLR